MKKLSLGLSDWNKSAQGNNSATKAKWRQTDVLAFHLQRPELPPRFQGKKKKKTTPKHPFPTNPHSNNSALAARIMILPSDLTELSV